MRYAYSFYYGRRVDALKLNKISQTEMAKVKEQSFFCEGCGEEVFIHRSVIKTPCFSHKSGSECSHSKSKMSEWHKKWQEKFDDTEVDYCIDYISKNRADVSLYSYRIVEFQNSKIIEDDFNERNFNYTKYRSLIWLFNLTKEIKKIKYDKNVNMYNWKTMWPCFREFNFKEYPKVQIYFQLYDESKYNQEIYKVAFFNNRDGYGYFKVSQKMSKQEFFESVTKVGIPDLLIKSDGELKQEIVKYQDKQVYKYHKCKKYENHDVEKEICESCPYHLYERKKHFCYYEFDELVKKKEIDKIDAKNQKIFFADGSNVEYYLCKNIKYRSVWQLYYDYELNRFKPQIKTFNVKNKNNEVYRVELDDGEWFGKRLSRKNKDSNGEPNFKEPKWRLL